MYCSSRQCWQILPCCLHKTKPMVVFTFYPNNSKPLICTLGYDEIDEQTKQEFESMSLAGSFLQIEDKKVNDYASGHFYDQEEYPLLHATLQYWKMVAQKSGQIYPYATSPYKLFDLLQTTKSLELTHQEHMNISVQHCILLSENLDSDAQTVHIPMRIWWRKVEPVRHPFKKIDCNSNDMKEVLNIAFAIVSPTLSSADYGFISLSQRQFNLFNNKQIYVQLEDSTIGFFFHQ